MSENNTATEATETPEGSVAESTPPVTDPAGASEATGGSMITDAAKLIRLGTMTQSLMTEARGAPLDEAGRSLLARIHTETMEALKETMSKDLLDELAEFQLCIDCADTPPTESELRIAQAQLVGWLQGLHQGFQAMAMAQQAAAMQQLQQLQAGGPPHAPGVPQGAPGEPIDASSRPGTYL
jgi:hypothetical protein